MFNIIEYILEKIDPIEETWWSHLIWLIIGIITLFVIIGTITLIICLPGLLF
jgi:uncharacterized membrane protein